MGCNHVFSLENIVEFLKGYCYCSVKSIFIVTGLLEQLLFNCQKLVLTFTNKQQWKPYYMWRLENGQAIH